MSVTKSNGGGVNNPDYVSTDFGVPNSFSKQTANGDTFLIQKGQLNNLRLRPQIMNEHAESSRNIQGTVTAGNIVGQIFKASQDNINGINLTLESAAGVIFDDFESYADDAALQAVWLATGEQADVEVATVFEGTQSMYLPCGVGQVTDTWKKSTGGGADFTGYTGQFQMYSNKEYKDVQLEVFVEDSLGNTASRQVVQSNKNIWTKVEVPTDSLIDDGAPTDMTDIDYIGFRVAKEKNDGYVIVDILISTPPAGSVEVKLWDMGDTLPVSAVTKLTDGTKYEKLGDLGTTGAQASSIIVDLFGGKRMYHLNDFVAGVALEIPENEVLNVNNYYAITIHHIDTDVSVYGANDAWDDYYKSGYGFITDAEANAITAMGAQKDIQFVIFSTQEVYINEISQFVDEVPNGSSLATLYVEDENMKRTDILIAGVQAFQSAIKELVRPFHLNKGAKFEQEYIDDFTDSVSKVTLIMQYFFEPPQVNG